MQCPLCGFEFDEHAMQCHTACGMHANCTIMCCPQCGYQMVDESKSATAHWLRRVFARKSHFTVHVPTGLKRLSELAPGQSGEVVSIVTQQPSRLDRLSALGVVPGSRITLRQRTPAFVLRVDETELTVDEGIAREILTRVA